MAKWLDKYENGGEYLGTTNKGFNYSPAWGGQFQMGGTLQPPMAGAVQTVPMAQKGKKQFLNLPSLKEKFQPNASVVPRVDLIGIPGNELIAIPNVNFEARPTEALSLNASVNAPMMISKRGVQGLGENSAFNYNIGAGYQLGENDYLGLNYGNNQGTNVTYRRTLGNRKKKKKKAEAGASIPGSVGFTYARTGSTPSEGPYAKKTLPSAQNGKRSKAKAAYDNVINKAFEIESNLLEKIDPNIEKAYEKAASEGLAEGMRNGPLDAIRHATSAASVSSAFPSWTNVIPGIGIAKFLGANALGAAHELTLRNSWRESGSDLYNNFIGSLIGALPISDDKKIDMVIGAQKRGILSNIDKPTKPKKENGGKMSFYQHGLDWTPRNISENGSEIPMAQEGKDIPWWMKGKGNVASSTAVKKPVVDRVLASGVKPKKGETFNQAYDRKKKELDAQSKRIREQQKVNNKKHAEKTIAERQARIKESEENPLSGAGILNSDNWTRENWAKTAVADKFRLFPNSAGGLGQVFDEYINPAYMIGSMADNLARAPLQAKETGSNMPYLTAIAAPLLAGRAFGSGAINPISKDFWTKSISNREFVNNLSLGLPGLLRPSSKWTKELVKGSIAAGKIKRPEFVTAIRAEAAGFDPSKVAAHPSLNPTQQTYTGKWVQTASKENPTAFDEVMAYVTGAETKNAGEMQLLSEVIPWSEAQKFAGKNLPFDAKTMSFGPGKYGTLENALQQGAITKREYALLKNYNAKAQKIKQSTNLSEATDVTVSRVRKEPELYNPNEMLHPELAAKMRQYPVVSGAPALIAAEIENLKNRALQGNLTTELQAAGREAARSATLRAEGEPTVNHRKGGVVKDNKGYWNPNNWGKVVEIDSPNITMKGVNQDLIGISDEGDVQYMEPGKDYKFKGKKVKEYPVAKNGVNQQDEKTAQHLDQLLNFTNKPKAKTGWLSKYE